MEEDGKEGGGVGEEPEQAGDCRSRGDVERRGELKEEGHGKDPEDDAACSLGEGGTLGYGHKKKQWDVV